MSMWQIVLAAWLFSLICMVIAVWLTKKRHLQGIDSPAEKAARKQLANMLVDEPYSVLLDLHLSDALLEEIVKLKESRDGNFLE
jgi:hypothetical protein